MSRLVFKAEEVRRCIEHAERAPDWSMGYSREPKQAGLLLVHDDGVYLMSNGSPPDKIRRVMRKGRPEEDGCFVAYAEGTDPTELEFDEWWETARELVGGDDFGQWLPLGMFANDEGDELVVLEFGEETIERVAS